MTFTSKTFNGKKNINLSKHRNKVWILSSFAIILSLAGFITSWLNPTVRFPLRPGLDFTGGTQIKLERKCLNKCTSLSSLELNEVLNEINFSKKETKQKIYSSRIQFLDGYKSVLIRMPTLSALESKKVVESMIDVAGPFEEGGQSIETIGPTLGVKLLKTTLTSLLVAFSCVAIYISVRFDRKFSLYAILALIHDVLIVCGVFSWLGILLDVEVNSLFAVALLTIAGYSVNDTVVVYDRIREINNQNLKLPYKQKIDSAVTATLTRTLYTSGTTLLPLLALIFFGGTSLYWFSIALAIGVVIGSWSSIALVPSFLSLSTDD